MTRLLTTVRTWRLALRIARREALRARGRSALVVAMIALPILGVTAADVLARSGELSPAEELTREMGRADAGFRVLGATEPVLQSPDGWEQHYGDAAAGDAEPLAPTRADLAALLPDGSTVLTEAGGSLVVATRDGVLRTEVREIDAAHPATEGIFALRRGRYPAGPGEVAATDAFLDESGLHVGSTLRVPDLGDTFLITGAYENPGDLNASEIVAPPGTLLSGPGGAAIDQYLVDVPGQGGVTWEMVQEANRLGFTVRSRSVILDPPPDDQVPYYAQYGRDSGPGVAIDATLVVGTVTAVALVVLEICLLAGPAFAVGARRSRHQLGLIGACGGEERQLRAVMLASGVVLGAVAAAAGISAGIALTLAAHPLLEEWTGRRLGSWDFRIAELAGIAGLAVLVGLAAALLPAVAAARRDVLESLTGRKGVRHTGRTLPVLGAVALLAGTALATAGSLLLDNTLVVAAGSILAELGLVALVPTLLGTFGLAARFLPLSGRLALRDAARNRARTAPAVAAVLAAVAGTIAATTSLVSDEAEARASYLPILPMGAVQVMAYSPETVPELDGARRAAERTLPIGERADLASLCAPTGPDGCGLVEPARFVESAQGALHVPLAVGGPALLDVLGIDDPDAAAALARGEAVVFAEAALNRAGRLPIDVSGATGGTDHTLTLRAHPVDASGYGVLALVPPAAADRAGLATQDLGTVYATTRLPTDAERQAFDAALEVLLPVPHTGIETGYEGGGTATGLLILALCAAVITLGAAGIATGLAQADAAPDLATLAAVGAPPRLRRVLSGLQCGLIAAVGVLLGSVAGVIPAIGVRLAQYRADLANWESYQHLTGFSDRPEFVVALPWETFAQLIVVVPVFACLVAALLTRSRVPLARRAG